jgi:pyruvate dehydrogenase E2 component (dihydrolipoamide acetyltransferase)
MSIVTQAVKQALTLAKPGKDRYADVLGVRVRYLEEGAHNPGVPLIIVHGYNGSCDYWYPDFLLSMGAARRVIALDLPGCGLSGKLPSHTLDTYVDFFSAFLGALDIAQADLLGHSMGGLIAISLAVRYPHHVRKLVLVDSAGLPELVKSQWLAPLKMLTDSSMRHFRLYPTFIKNGLRARAGVEGLQIIRTGSVRRILKQVQTPTLVLWGSRDRVVPLEHGAFMARHIPNARFAVVRGAGHMPFYEKPEQCNKIVLSFLRDD